MKTKISKDLKASMTRADFGIHREVKNCVATSKNRLSGINLLGSNEAPSRKLKSRNETPKGSVSRSAESGCGSSNVGGSGK